MNTSKEVVDHHLKSFSERNLNAPALKFPKPLASLRQISLSIHFFCSKIPSSRLRESVDTALGRFDGYIGSKCSALLSRFSKREAAGFAYPP
jgi:hypothetical protein